MYETCTQYDTADYLKTDADIAAYLEASTKADDPKLMAAALGAVARARNMSKLSREAGLAREGLYKALPGEGNPSFATVSKIAKALSYQMTLRPVKSA